MIKSIFVDLDGVIFQGAEKFSIKYAKEYNINLNNMTTFFINQFKLCLTGDADLKEELSKVVTEWNWPGTVDELVQYWIKDTSNTNDELINSLNEKLHNDIKIFVVTQQEKNRAEQLRIFLGDKLNYTDYFSTHKIHFVKSDAKFYLECLRRSTNTPNEVLFIDDDMKNISIAKEVGLKTIFYKDNKSTIDNISKIINENK
jgi:FMN phosphatase YigB (HAD superfamily)